MQSIWSPQRKHSTWRRIWLALAQSQRELGLDISQKQIDELAAHLDDIDFTAAAKYEQSLRHDVMAHIHALGDVAPTARPIIHLGATSQDVNCNTELLQVRDSLTLIAAKLANVIVTLGSFAARYRALPTLAFTHFQAAQPTTVGKRAAVWAHDFALALDEIQHRLNTLCLRGVKGATGTQASFLDLFHGDEKKVDELDRKFVARLGFDPARRYAVTGQTYPRIVDAQIVNALAVAAAAIHKSCNDIRLLAHRKEVEEPFDDSQVGSSAMPYKRNPMRCERATGLARFVISLAANPLNTAATQWLERTLDDSSNRRLVLPESFLALDGALDIMHNVAAGLIVNERVIRAGLDAEMPFLVSESLLMAAVSRGADRQSIHELIRKHSIEAGNRVKHDGLPNDLLARLSADPAFRGIDIPTLIDPARHIGRAPSQVDEFIAAVVDPIRKRYAASLTPPPPLRV